MPLDTPIAYKEDINQEWKFGFLVKKGNDWNGDYRFTISNVPKLGSIRDRDKYRKADGKLIVRPLSENENDHYQNLTTDWAKNLVESKNKYESEQEKNKDNENQRREILLLRMTYIQI